MALISIQRKKLSSLSTIGELSLNGKFFCFTLEPPRGKCIPAGVYKASIYISPRWTAIKRYDFRVPLLHDVPGFSDIEIHIGNYPDNTEGCTLVGTSSGRDLIGNSEQAFYALFHRLPPEFEVEYLDINSPPTQESSQ